MLPSTDSELAGSPVANGEGVVVGRDLERAAAASETGGRHRGMLRFIARRVATGIATLFVISIIVFAATNVLPGNVADVVLGKNATPAALHTLSTRLGLNQSLPTRYVDWIGNLAQGNLGDSAVALAQNQPNPGIGASIASPLQDSLILAALTAFVLVPLSVLLGVVAGMKAGKPTDHVVSGGALVLGAFPEFVVGTLLVLLMFNALHLLPPLALLNPGQSPFARPDALILPVVTLLGITTASCARQIRAGVIRVLGEDYIAMAVLNGLPRRRVLWQYVVRNALAPSVQIVAENLRYLIGSIIVVESVFAYPGIGTYVVNAVSTRDVTEVQAVAIILGATFIAINIVSDIIVVLLVPKLRTGLA